MIKKILLLGVLFLSSSCLNNVEDIRGSDQSDVSFISDVQPILQQYCTSCHNSNFAQNNADLTTYSAILNSVGIEYGNTLVIPGNATASGLVDVIEPNPEKVRRMPLNGSLTGNEINTIKAWINEGAQNN